jgi:hypothetical protein
MMVSATCASFGKGPSSDAKDVKEKDRSRRRRGRGADDDDDEYFQKTRQGTRAARPKTSTRSVEGRSNIIPYYRRLSGRWFLLYLDTMDHHLEIGTSSYSFFSYASWVSVEVERKEGLKFKQFQTRGNSVGMRAIIMTFCFSILHQLETIVLAYITSLRRDARL